MRTLLKGAQPHSTFVTPTGTPPPTNVVLARNTSPFCLAMCLPVQSNIDIVAAILLLNLLGGPFYVADLVMAVDLDAFKGMLWTSTPANMRQKLIKGFKAKLNPATAVVTVNFVLKVGTAVFRVVIGAVFRCDVYPRFTVRSFRFLNSLRMPTSTRLCVTTFQCGCGDTFILSAITSAIPMSVSVMDTAKRRDGQVVESLAGQILKTFRCWFVVKLNSMINISHSVFSSQKMVWIKAVRRLQNSVQPACILT